VAATGARAAGSAGDRIFERRSAERDCSRDDRPFNALAEFQCDVNMRIDRHLDLVTAIFTRPEVTNFVFAHVADYFGATSRSLHSVHAIP
jgi:hypothetical protein